jgi:hypothetical protein
MTVQSNTAFAMPSRGVSKGAVGRSHLGSDWHGGRARVVPPCALRSRHHLLHRRSDASSIPPWVLGQAMPQERLNQLPATARVSRHLRLLGWYYRFPIHAAYARQVAAASTGRARTGKTSACSYILASAHWQCRGAGCDVSSVSRAGMEERDHSRVVKAVNVAPNLVTLYSKGVHSASAPIANWCVIRPNRSSAEFGCVLCLLTARDLRELNEVHPGDDGTYRRSWNMRCIRPTARILFLICCRLAEASSGDVASLTMARSASSSDDEDSSSSSSREHTDRTARSISMTVENINERALWSKE